MLIASLPSFVLLLGIMIHQEFSGYLIAICLFVQLMLITFCVLKTIQQQSFREATITNLVESMVNNEFTIRRKSHTHNDAIGDMLNRLSTTMSAQQREIKQQEYLINKIMNNIDVSIIALDENQSISFINHATELLFDEPASKLEHRSASDLGIQSLIEHENSVVLEWHFPSKHGRFQVNKDSYFENGQRKTLLFITDVSAILREEKHQAWSNLFRVLSHEINNSLTPIASLSQVLHQLLPKEKDESLLEVEGGLKVIEERSRSLKTFVDSYRTLSQLPEPSFSETRFSKVVEGIKPLFAHRNIEEKGDASATISLDPIQIQQTLINIFKNADEAMEVSEGAILIEWKIDHNQLLVLIYDEGTGLSNKNNIFVPFYTTKVSGGGIGLTLCRTIAENHGGYFTIDNRDDKPGCLAKLILPIKH
ncbi:PAS domain-containing sensor histidine kinase [Vibrio splendidus]